MTYRRQPIQWYVAKNHRERYPEATHQFPLKSAYAPPVDNRSPRLLELRTTRYSFLAGLEAPLAANGTRVRRQSFLRGRFV